MCIRDSRSSSGAPYTSEGDFLPRRLDTRRWLPVIVAMLLLGVAGIALVFIAVRRPHSSGSLPPETSGVASMIAASATASVGATATALISESASTTQLDLPASVTASAASAPKVRSNATTAVGAKRKCRIVTAVDAAGHTTFKEVCP